MKSICLRLAIVVALCGCRSSPGARDASSSPAHTEPISGNEQETARLTAQQPTKIAPAISLDSSSKVISLLPPSDGSIHQVVAHESDVPESPNAQSQAPAPIQSDVSTAPTVLPAPTKPPGEPIETPRTERKLSIRDALAIGLTENPDLVTIRGTESVGAAAVNVAGVYPWNPFVQAQYLPNGRPFFPGTPGNAIGQSSYYVWAMQRFELAHQRRHREDSAMAALGQIRWNIQQAELLNVAQTERLFFAALYQRQLRELAADAETLGDRLAAIIERRLRAGLASNVQTINAQIAVRQTRRQRELADAAYQAALLALRQQLGIVASEPIALTGDLTQYEWFSVASAACRISGSAPDDPQLLVYQMAEARPDVMALRSAISMAQANLNLARAARVPDVQAGPIYTTADDGTQYLGLRLQREFGVFNNGTALARQRSSEVQQQFLAFEQLKRRAINEAGAAIDRYERARQLTARASQEASQNPPPELEQVLNQFEAGNAQIVDVVAVQNNLLLESRSYLDLLNEVAQSAALVTQTTGVPPERLFAQRPPSFTEPTGP